MTSPTSILIVDDEPAVRDVMARWLAGPGVTVRTAASADEALAAAGRSQCDLAVIDVRMPGHDGVWLKNELQRAHPHTAVVLAIAYTDLLDRDEATTEVADLLVKPFARDRFLLAVDRGKRWHKQALEDLRWHAQLLAEIRDRTGDLARTLADAAAHGTPEIEAVAALLETRAPLAAAHTRRVAPLAAAVAATLGVEAAPAGLVELVAQVHDIGKAAMPEALLTKPSPYTAAERAMMRRHVEVGVELLAGTATLAATAPYVLASHEWYGGGGYPLNLAGERIPLVSRIVAVADAFDAMTAAREYRPLVGVADATAELLRCSGTQFDPDVVAALLTVLGCP